MTSKWINYQLYGSSFPEDTVFDTPPLVKEPAVSEEHVELLSHIRFPMMSLVNLCQLQQDPIANMHSEFFIDRIGLAMKFHSSNTEERKKLKEFQSNRNMYKARNYSDKRWSTDLEIAHFSSLPENILQPVVFSSLLSGSEADSNRTWEWIVDFYPKGIQFGKCVMINLWRNLEVEGATLSLVRFLLKSNKSQVCTPEVAILISGVQDHVEYVKKVVSKKCFFDEKDSVVKIDELIPYGELNISGSTYLVGEQADTFKLAIIVKPSQS